MNIKWCTYKRRENIKTRSVYSKIEEKKNQILENVKPLSEENEIKFKK